MKIEYFKNDVKLSEDNLIVFGSVLIQILTITCKKLSVMLDFG